MKLYPKPITTPVRVERWVVHLPCKLITSVDRFHGAVVNLSWGGLGIELKDVSSKIDLAEIERVAVELLGSFDVHGRNFRGHRIGVMFTDRDDAKEQIRRYLAAHGLVVS